MDGITPIVLEAGCSLSLGQPLRSRPQCGIGVCEWERLNGARQRLWVRLLGHFLYSYPRSGTPVLQGDDITGFVDWFC
jgi:hypothetical protein